MLKELITVLDHYHILTYLIKFLTYLGKGVVAGLRLALVQEAT